MNLGIGIITYNRLEYLKEIVNAVRVFTRTDYELVVADDGSTDGTVEWCKQNGVRCITGPNRGIAWNKNRAIYFLKELLNVDAIILFEDDVRLWEVSWETDWITAMRIWGHVAWTHQQPEFMTGEGSSIRPYMTDEYGGSCVGYMPSVIEQVGYMDTRFKGYGYEHIEHSSRISTLLHEKWGVSNRYIPCMTAHIGVLWGHSWINPETMLLGKSLMEDIKDDPIYRNPWHGNKEKTAFLKEIKSCSGITLRDQTQHFTTIEIPFKPERCPATIDCPYPHFWSSVGGQTCEKETLEFLAALVNLIKPQLVVETGAHLGWSAYYMGQALAKNNYGQLITCDIEDRFCEITRERCIGLPVTVQQVSSVELEVESEIDFLFLDCADHTRIPALEYFLPRLSMRGLVAVHDTNGIYPWLREQLEAQGLMVVHLPSPRGLSLLRRKNSDKIV